MGLAFINQGFLWALSLAGIPIIIHLLQRRRFRVRRWGAMEFLRLSIRNRARRLRLEQIVLLLIRCLILAFIALAVARPVLRPSPGAMNILLATGVVLGCLLALAALTSLSAGTDPRPYGLFSVASAAVVALGLLAITWLVGTNRGAALLRSDSRVHAIIVLDNSFSMGYAPAGAEKQTLFDLARQRALDLIQRGLRNGDAVSLVLGADPPRAVIRRPSFDLEAAAAQVRRASLSDQATNFGKVARLCLELFQDATNRNREVYLITDSQANGWQGPGVPLAADAWNALRQQEVRLNLLAVRDPDAQNMAVASVQVARGLVTARQQARLKTRILNHTPRTSTVSVRLEMDGRPAETLQTEVPARGEATVVVSHRFPRPGLHTVAVRLAGDRLDRDDVGYLSVRVRDRVRVLVLNGRSDPLSSRDAAAFLVAAMAPDPEGPGSEPTPLEPEVVAGNSFGTRDLSQYDLVALCNVPSLGEEDRTALATFVQAGGGVLIFPGDRVSAPFYNQDLLAGQPSLLPARLGPLIRSLDGKVTVDPATIDHAALNRFKGATDVDLGTAAFSRYFQLEPRTEDRSVQVMVRFTNGAPLLVEKRLGQGEVILAASGANGEWNELPYKPAFVPLVQELCSHLAQGGEHARNLLIGDPLIKPLPLNEATKRVEVTLPDDRQEAVKPVVDERGCTVTYRGTDRAGIYRLAVEGNGTTDTFGVNVDARESDLRSLDAGQLARLLPGARWNWVDQNEDILAAIRRARLGVEIWPHLVYLALLLMVAETALAQTFGRRA
ncbi:MAG: BatA domain-containing protein [Armatimonadetes bacterium]|nr:BatA domain-containing protein [Armatimonadota bacterium]